jgi:uncharacterized protein (DUF2141 family)
MKKTIFFCTGLVAGLFFIVPSSNAQAKDNKLSVSGIRSGKGRIVLNVFKDNETYDKEQPYKKFLFDKKGLANGILVVSYALEPGIYGITLLDDENENGKIDKNLLGIPKEGFGFSNFFMEERKKPSFDDFKVDLKSANAKVEIKVKYM